MDHSLGSQFLWEFRSGQRSESPKLVSRFRVISWQTAYFEMLSSIGQQSTTSSSSSCQTLRLVNRDRLIAQRVRVKPHEKLISKTADAARPQQNSLDNLCDLSTDFDFNANSNGADLLDLSNSQMSSFFREFSNGKNTLWKEEKKSAATNYKTVKGLGFYSCDSCPFLCLNVKLFLEHGEKDHHYHHSPLKSLLKTKCIGCDNIFYSINVLRVSIKLCQVLLWSRINYFIQV